MKYFLSLLRLFAFILFFSACKTAPQSRTFIVDRKSPSYQIGETEAYFNKFFSAGGIKKAPIEVFYYPAEDAVCLQFVVNYVTCNQYWNRENRDKFKETYLQYREEHREKKLIVNKNRKTKNIYGSGYCFFTWQLTKISILASTNPKIEYGYFYREKKPIYTINQLESYYEDPISKDRSKTSPVMQIYFNFAMADRILELFDQEYLRSFGNNQSSQKADNNIDIDEY
jgi:hypothetical protein